MAKLVYHFANGRADGNAGMKSLLGGKGANLAEMTRLQIPVPPGFTISTRACTTYAAAGRRLSRELLEQVQRAMRRLERIQRRGFGDAENPLLVSVRSGAKFSMPGMMDTVLNLGLGDRSAAGLARSTGDRRFAFDAYRRFLQMYGDVVLGLGKHVFEAQLAEAKRRVGVQADTELDAAALEALCRQFQQLVRKATGRAFPQDPWVQLRAAIEAVFRSWDNPRARLYRRQYGIPDDLGTAVNVQAMVFGNLGDDCATGVAFTRNPATGANELYGEYLVNAQGEDVVAGIRTPLPLARSQASRRSGESLEERMPDSYDELQAIRQKLERHYRDMQDVEFTIERGRLYMLQTRTGKRTGIAALRIAFDLHRSRRIAREELLRRIDPDMLAQLLAPEFDPRDVEAARRVGRIVARGLPAGPGAASGVVALTAPAAERLAAAGHEVLLVRNETSPEDIGGMVAACGILTSRGGMTSHAAVVARGMGKPCVVGAESLHVDEVAGQLRVDGQRLAEGDALSVDGSTGEVILGRLLARPSTVQRALLGRGNGSGRAEVVRQFSTVMRWSDRIRRMGVRANADTPEDAGVARAMGAQGIGLCRTEHMFFAEERISAVRRMILAADEPQRRAALAELLPMQRRDFVGIFGAMRGFPVTIRLLDPPLHEFLPTTEEQFAKLGRELGVRSAIVRGAAERLREANPMLGHRGCRLGITFPEIYEMQARAILEAAATCRKRRIVVEPEIMIPLVGTVAEYRELDGRIREVAAAVMDRSGVRIRFRLGTMIEVPRACLVAGEIARHAEFFSFGTNDLTQMTYGYSRDDVGKFLPAYLERRILEADPFRTLDVPGVGRLVRIAIEEARRERPSLKIGVCGEHGGDSASIAFFHAVGADYVSCSPYRVPIARLAAAQAALEREGRGSGTA